MTYRIVETMKKTVWALLVGCVVGSAGSARATDIKIYPGSMCRQLGRVITTSYGGSGHLHNKTSVPVSVLCPVIRDVSTKSWSSMLLTVQDRHATDRVVCRGVSANIAGDGGWSTSNIATGDEQPYTEDLSIPAPSYSVNEGTFYIRCTLPAVTSLGASGILRYQVTEP